MVETVVGTRVGARKVRRVILITTALGGTIGIAGTASAQNISSLNNTNGYSLSETGTRSGGPRTIDIAASGGDIVIDVDTVIVDNPAASNVTGVGIAANNTGPGNVTIRDNGITATGTGLTYGIDARVTTGTLAITNTGTITTSGNNGDIAIRALSGGGDVTITSNIATSQRRAIFVGSNGGTFGDTGTTTINSTNATADGTGLVNAIIGQGYRVVINSGTASITNAGGVQGTAIFANASAGGVLINAGTTSAFGQNQAAIQAFSEGAVDLTSGTVRTTQNSDGLSVASGTDIVVRSTAITTEGTGGARGIVIGGNAGGGGFNSGPNGIAYSSAAITSGSISTVGNGAYGIYVTPTGAGTTTINSNAITTTGANAIGIYVTAIGTGSFSGATTINSTGALSTSGANATGIQVNGGTGALSITGSGTIAASGANAQGIWAINAGGPVTINASDVRTIGVNGAAIVVQQTAGSTAPINITAGIIRAGGAGINLSSNGTTGAITASVVDSITFGPAIDARSVGAVSLTGGTVRTTGAGNTSLIAISTGGDAVVNSTNLTSANRGIYAQGLNTVTVNSGTLVSTNADYGLIARTSAANNGDPVVGTAAGVVTVTSTNLTATNIGINAYGPRATINVTSGVVTTGNANGIEAFGLDVNVKSATVTTGGGSGINAGNANGATRAANVVIDSGTINVVGTTQANTVALSALGQSISITSGTVTTSGTGNRGGINAVIATQTAIPNDGSFVGNITINSGSVSTVGDGAYAIRAVGDAGLITINSTGSIVTAGGMRAVGDGTFRYSDGIEAVSFNGSIKVTSNNIATSGNNVAGIRVEANSGTAQYAPAANPLVGAVSVASSGLIATTGNLSNGILSTTGADATTITNSGTITTAGADSFGISANATTGAVAINSNIVRTSGNGSGGVSAQTTSGAITIVAGTTSTTGAYDGNTNGTDAVIGIAGGAGNVTITSGTASASGQFASAVFGSSNGGNVTVTSGTATTSGATGAAVGGVARTAGDVVINAITTTASGQGATGVAANAVVGNATVVAGTATSSAGTAIASTGGKISSVTATSATGGGDGASGVKALGGTGVVLNIGSASSNGTATSRTNAQTGVVTVTRADAINAIAINGRIDATIGSASATGAGADAIRLIANGTGGGVTANITGTVSSASGYGIFIDPPGAVVVNIGNGASIAGSLAGINTTGATNAITNLGSITSASGPAILAAGTTTLVNSGRLSGANNVAAQFGATNDSVTLTTGSSVTGRIVGGGGTDAAFLTGSSATVTGGQTIAGFTGFDSLTVSSGYWTADAANSSSFNTATINSGATLGVTNGATGLSGVTAASIVDNGTLVVTSSAASAGSTFGTSIVTGSGNVLLTGPGTVTLDGTNSIATTGTITVTGLTSLNVTGTNGGNFVTTATGALLVGGGGTTGMVTGTVVNNGAVVVNRSDDTTFTAALSGSGNLIKQGAGKLTFGTNYSFTGVTTIEAGSIRLSTPVASNTEIDLEGAGQLDLSGTTQVIAELAGASRAASINLAGASLTDNQNTNTNFAGSLVGAGGSFTKGGTGTLNLTGTNTYTGPTTVNGGKLAVNGSIVSPVTVNNGGALGGTGSVGTTVITSGGTFAPGNSIGTITVNGNLTFAAGSIYAVEVNAAGAGDRINATGTATLTGGTVQVLAEAGTYNRLTDYTILTAAGGLTGRFGSVTTNYAFLSPLLSYGSNSVTLTLARNDVAFGTMATTPNQLAVANAVSARSVSDPVFTTVLFQTAASAPGVFNQLSGELFASLPSELTDQGRRVREAVLERGAATGSGLGIWGDFLRTNASSRVQPGLARIRSDRTGGVGGIDYSVNGIRIGVYGGYQKDRSAMLGRSDSAGTESYYAGASLSYVRGPVSLQAGGDYAWHNIDTRRVLTTPGIAATLVASPNANTTQLYAELGYRIVDGPVTVTPFVRNAYSWTRIDAFSETGGVAALSVARESRGTDVASVGIRMGGSARVTDNVQLLPLISIAYSRGFGDRDGTSVARIGGTGPAFAITGASLGKDALTIDGGFDLQFGKRFTIGAHGFGSTSKQWSDYGARASIGFRF